MVETRKFAAGTSVSSVEKAPARLEEHRADVGKKTLRQVLEPIQDQLLSASELDTLCARLNKDKNSPLAIEIMQKNLYCFGRPGSILVPYLYWNRGMFYRRSYRASSKWGSLARVVFPA